jgi:hypothetical protein
MPKLVSAACLILLVAAFAGAATIQVTEIKASGSGDKVTVDPKLSDLSETLTQRFRFSRYDFVSSRSSSVKTGGTASWKLATGLSLDITLNGVEDSGGITRYSLTVQVYSVGKDGKRTSFVNTTVKAPKGEVWLFGIEQKSGELGYTPILAIKAQ